MIRITDKCNCCGCSACVQVCPKQCISLKQDAEGFLYPFADERQCIDCGLCEQVCPYLNQSEICKPLKVLAAENPDDEVRMKSSSGGIFTMLAEQTLSEGGVVFGARFDDNWEVIHSYTESIEGLTAFRGSKYVQSRIGDSYKQARDFLKQDCKVMFSGTPCQIAGLKLFLKKDYDNLLTVECVCHGVPGPGLWQMYLKEQVRKDGQTIDRIKSINFRDKRTGWRNYSFSIEYLDGRVVSQCHDDNPWERAFIRNIDLRPSCYNCRFKLLSSSADVTLGDLWGAEEICQEHTDDKGLSLVVVHTAKGEAFIPDSVICEYMDIDTVARYNRLLKESSTVNAKAEKFWTIVPKGFIKAVNRYAKDSFMLRMKRKAVKLIDRYWI